MKTGYMECTYNHAGLWVSLVLHLMKEIQCTMYTAIEFPNGYQKTIKTVQENEFSIQDVCQY